MTEITRAQALNLRMHSLLLRSSSATPVDSPPPGDVASVVSWFGAMQAQDLGSVLWSLGVRLPTFTKVDVEAALERREAVRTWPMRGTVHLVPPRDVHWMLEVMGSRSLAAAARRRTTLGISEECADQGVDALAAALAGGGRLTRAECLAVLADTGVPIGGQGGYHLLWYAAQRGVICIAPSIGTQQTFVLLDDWVPDPHRPDRDEALATIALRYFRGHGPTTVRDFAGWTGLTITDSRRGVAAAGDALAGITVDGVPMVLDPAVLGLPAGRDPADDLVALPGFDEYLLGFKDRSLMVDADHLQAIIPGGNGVFQPTIVRSGRVVATWKRKPARGRTGVEVRPLPASPNSSVPALGARAEVEAALARYAHYLGQPIEVVGV